MSDSRALAVDPRHVKQSLDSRVSVVGVAASTTKELAMLNVAQATNSVSTTMKTLTYWVLFPTEKDGGEGEPEEFLFPRFQPEYRGVSGECCLVFPLFLCLRDPMFPEDPSGGGEYRPEAPLGTLSQDFVPLFDPDTGGGGGNDVLAGPFIPMLILLCLLFPCVASGGKGSSGMALRSLVEAPQMPQEGQP